MGIKFSDQVENIVGNEEIARHEPFLLFPQCFQKASVVDALKPLDQTAHTSYVQSGPALHSQFFFHKSVNATQSGVLQLIEICLLNHQQSKLGRTV